MSDVSPLLHGVKTKSSLDLITERLYFIWPLSESQIEWLNTIVYKDDVFWINYWSYTHLVFGMFWELLRRLTFSTFPVFSKLLNVKNFIIFHTIFEIWELWAGGYFSGIHKFDFQEFVDCVVDTLFGLLGIYFIKLF